MASDPEHRRPVAAPRDQTDEIASVHVLDVSRHQPVVRVTDADRDEAVERLRLALGEDHIDLDEFDERVGKAYGAQTPVELLAVLHDIAPLPEPLPIPPATTRWTVAVLSSSRRSGSWLPAQRSRVVAVLGNCRLDFEQVALAADTEVVVAAVFGGVEVIVPEGMRVELGGFAFLGSKSDRERRTAAGATGPVLHIRVRAVLGSVNVRTRRRCQ